MGNYILLFISVLFNTLSSVFHNTLGKNKIKNNADLQMFNAIQSIVTMAGLLVIYAIIGQKIPTPSTFTVLLGIVFGIATALGCLFNIKALEIGPLSYTKVIISAQMIIPSFCGYILFGQSISVWQIIAIFLMIASFILSVDRKNDNGKRSLKWFIFCIISFLASGSVGVMQTIHQKSEFKSEISAFLLIAFATSAIFSLILVPVYNKKDQTKVTLFKSGKLVWFFVLTFICGIAVAFCNHYNMYLSGVMDTAIFFPLVNGGSLVLTTLYGLVICKEKLTKLQAIGLGIGCVGILLLCNIVSLIGKLFA